MCCDCELAVSVMKEKGGADFVRTARLRCNFTCPQFTKRHTSSKTLQYLEEQALCTLEKAVRNPTRRARTGVRCVCIAW